ncbi:plasmalemma vesicle-associated protein isoform X2 [Antechinus flavipes]|uniref:plasmalemma vesicle-associated protein isoform X2 n=1 Tax=Antechinus flavipes TaxID=38775 RepID=UPI00223662DB|nr:plasmalemma vesicle-associated protein isoform X2 [Antechinus flavipes]
MDRSSSYSRTGLHISSSEQRGCWYYLKYFFLFVSLIQFLIILGLVLFMVYGNAHAGTEAHLKETEKQADSLSGRLLNLGALNTNLSKELNITTRSREAIMQLLLGSRRDLDRINASYRQCQNQHESNMKYVFAIVKSEEACRQELAEHLRNCTAHIQALEEKAKAAQAVQETLKMACNKDKETLMAAKGLVESQLKACSAEKMSNFREYQLVVGELQHVRDMCAAVDKDKLVAKVEQVWRESLLYKSLDSITLLYYNPEVEKVVHRCRELPRVMLDKVESLARELKVGIEQVARENTELKRQKEAGEKSLAACKEEKDRVLKETQERLQKVHEDCVKQSRLALEEKVALQKEKDALKKELEEKKKELALIKGQLDINTATLETCIKTKAQGSTLLQRSPAPAKPAPLDHAALEEFKKRVMNTYQKAGQPSGNPASG